MKLDPVYQHVRRGMNPKAWRIGQVAFAVLALLSLFPPQSAQSLLFGAISMLASIAFALVAVLAEFIAECDAEDAP